MNLCKRIMLSQPIKRTSILDLVFNPKNSMLEIDCLLCHKHLFNRVLSMKNLDSWAYENILDSI